MKELIQQIEQGYHGKRKGLPYTKYVSVNVAKPFSALFFSLNVSPNWVTTLSMLLALTAIALLFALPSRYLAGILAGLVLQLSYTLDCSDGQVARLSGKASPQGAWLDLLMDRLSGFLLPTGLFYWFWQSELFQSTELFFGVFVFTLFTNTMFSYAANLKGLVLKGYSDAGKTSTSTLKEVIFFPSDTPIFYWIIAASFFFASWKLMVLYSFYKGLLLFLVIANTLLPREQSGRNEQNSWGSVEPRKAGEC